MINHNVEKKSSGTKSSEDILLQIVNNKRQELITRKNKVNINVLKEQLKTSKRSFYDALNNNQSDFIFECKKASPSKGLIREDFDLEEILSVYKDYASAISVLTDYTYFKGDFKYLKQASESVQQPILCKDFFIDSYQVYEARYYGADAILLMLSVLNDRQYIDLASIAKSLNLDVLTEVHDHNEMQRALKLNAKIIGINNRNLKDLSINLATTEKLISELPDNIESNILFISESGINTQQDIKRLSPKVNGFLIGSSIMSKKDIRLQCKKLIYGNTKICGLNDPEIAKQAFDCGAIYGGLIFYPPSPRSINLLQAKAISQSTALKYVGVFVDHDINDLINIAKTLSLSVIQLHGNESDEYILQIKQSLPQCKIWKAISVKSNSLNDFQATYNNNNLAGVLLDTFSSTSKGGSGQTFDWLILEQLNVHEKAKTILAGGLTSSNIKDASQYNPFVLDINSGVESSAGIKDKDLIAKLYQNLRA